MSDPTESLDAALADLGTQAADARTLAEGVAADLRTLRATVEKLTARVDALTQPQLEAGVNWHAVWSDQNDPAVRGVILDQLKTARLSWVRIDIAWSSCQPTAAGVWDETFMSKLDTRIAEARARGFKVCVMSYWPPAWSSGTTGKNGQPKNGADYGRFLAALALRYAGRVDALEMWNEPDLSVFWASADPAAFAQMITAAYPIAKAAAPGMTFVLGAPTHLGLAKNWHKTMYAAGIKGTYDALAIHPYMSPSNLPPDTDTPATRTWSIAGIADLRALMAANADTAPVWATEFGWSTHANTGTEPNYKRGVSEADQAVFTVAALRLLAAQGVTKAFLYTDRDMTLADVHEASFGLLRRDLTAKPVIQQLGAR